MKKVWLVLCMITTMLLLAACGSTKTSANHAYDEEALKAIAKENFKWFQSEEFKNYLPEDDEEVVEVPENLVLQYGEEVAKKLVDASSNYDTLFKSLGGFVEEKDVEIIYGDENATVVYSVKYENKTLLQTTIFDKKMNLISMEYDVYRTFGEIMEKALMNTFTGMGVVFVVLIFISFVIYLLKFIPKVINKLVNNNQPTTLVEPVMTPTVVEEEDEVVDDLELVAVITAAIMASMSEEEKANGLVVRSIRKVNKSRWKNA